MPDYCLYCVSGVTYFSRSFLLERHGNDLMVRHIDSLRSVVRNTRKRWPFHIDAWVVRVGKQLYRLFTLGFA
jgi:putative transposase